VLRLLALVVVVLPQLNCAAAIALPPTRTDVGTMVVHDGAMHNGTRVSSGMHWASGTRSRNVPFDIGAGAVYEHRAAAANEVPKSVGQPASAAEHTVGGYIEAASRLSASGVTRSWIGGRAELLRHTGSGESTASLSARLSWEVYGGGTSAGADGGGSGFAAYLAGGTIGIGPYLETGVRRASVGHTEMLVTAGLSVRLPAIVAFGFAAR
jgi:hypothetical protein